MGIHGLRSSFPNIPYFELLYTVFSVQCIDSIIDEAFSSASIECIFRRF